jgi:hypothetical protein
MRHVGHVGPYVLEYDDSIQLGDDIEQTDDPPSYHLSWLAQPGLAFAMHVLVDRYPSDERKWHRLLDGAQAETAEQFSATQIRDIDGRIGAGIDFAGRRLAGLGGRFQGNKVIVEHYVGRAHDDIVDLVYRFHNEHVDRADSWRMLFHTMVFSSIIKRGYALHP